MKRSNYTDYDEINMFSHLLEDLDPKCFEPGWKPKQRTPEEIEADKRTRLDFEAEAQRIDRLYGKIMPFCYSPTGPMRDPETADDPALARKLLKEQEASGGVEPPAPGLTDLRSGH